MSFDMASVAEFVQKIEGPYKWYIIAAAIVIFTAIISRLVFKTLKWLLLLALLAILVIGVLYYFGYSQSLLDFFR